MINEIVVYSTLTTIGLFFLFTGVFSLRAPVQFAKSLSLDARGPSGRVEIRAQYGGFFTAAGLSQFAGLLGWLPFATAFWMAVVTFSGLFLGRCFAALFNSDRLHISRPIKYLYVVDAVGLAMSLLGLLITLTR